MQRMAWTDERLEERFDGIDRRFDEVDRRFDEVDRRFEQVDKRFEQVDKRFEQVDKRFDRVEGQIVELRQGVTALHATLNRGSIGIIIALVGVVGAILVHGG